MRTRPLIVADRTDRLAKAVGHCLPDAGWAPHVDTLPAASLVMDDRGEPTSGRIAVAGTTWQLRDISGVLFRPGRRWHRLTASDSPTTAFIHRERQAMVCAMLHALPCPVLNRLSPAWFFDKRNHSMLLASRLAGALGCLPPPGPRSRSSRPTAPSIPPWRSSLYLVNGDVVPVGPASPRLDLGAHAAALQHWRHANGIDFARLDFAHEGDGSLRLVHADPAPSMAEATDREVACVGRLVAEAMR